MTWKGQTIADLSRAFLSTNGAVKHTSVFVPARKEGIPEPFAGLRAMAGSLKCGSRRGLAARQGAESLRGERPFLFLRKKKRSFTPKKKLGP